MTIDSSREDRALANAGDDAAPVSTTGPAAAAAFAGHIIGKYFVAPAFRRGPSLVLRMLQLPGNSGGSRSAKSAITAPPPATAFLPRLLVQRKPLVAAPGDTDRARMNAIKPLALGVTSIMNQPSALERRPGMVDRRAAGPDGSARALARSRTSSGDSGMFSRAAAHYSDRSPVSDARDLEPATPDSPGVKPVAVAGQPGGATSPLNPAPELTHYQGELGAVVHGAARASIAPPSHIFSSSRSIARDAPDPARPASGAGDRILLQRTSLTGSNASKPTILTRRGATTEGVGVPAAPPTAAGSQPLVGRPVSAKGHASASDDGQANGPTLGADGARSAASRAPERRRPGQPRAVAAAKRIIVLRKPLAQRGASTAAVRLPARLASPPANPAPGPSTASSSGFSLGGARSNPAASVRMDLAAGLPWSPMRASAAQIDRFPHQVSSTRIDASPLPDDIAAATFSAKRTAIADRQRRVAGLSLLGFAVPLDATGPLRVISMRRDVLASHEPLVRQRASGMQIAPDLASAPHGGRALPHPPTPLPRSPAGELNGGLGMRQGVRAYRHSTGRWTIPTDHPGHDLQSEAQSIDAANDVLRPPSMTYRRDEASQAAAAMGSPASGPALRVPHAAVQSAPAVEAAILNSAAMSPAPLASGQRSHSDQASDASSMPIQMLADRIFRILERRLVAERERHGFRP